MTNQTGLHYIWLHTKIHMLFLTLKQVEPKRLFFKSQVFTASKMTSKKNYLNIPLSLPLTFLHQGCLKNLLRTQLFHLWYVKTHHHILSQHLQWDHGLQHSIFNVHNKCDWRMYMSKEWLTPGEKVVSVMDILLVLVSVV